MQKAFSDRFVQLWHRPMEGLSTSSGVFVGNCRFDSLKERPTPRPTHPVQTRTHRSPTRTLASRYRIRHKSPNLSNQKRATTVNQPVTPASQGVKSQKRQSPPPSRHNTRTKAGTQEHNKTDSRIQGPGLQNLCASILCFEALGPEGTGEDTGEDAGRDPIKKRARGKRKALRNREKPRETRGNRRNKGKQDKTKTKGTRQRNSQIPRTQYRKKRGKTGKTKTKGTQQGNGQAASTP